MSDALVSIGTAIKLIFTQIGMPIIDTIWPQYLVTNYYTGFGIFKESIFALSDGLMSVN